MTFAEWKVWFRRLPGVIKWFVLLILIRPVTDNFYYLKDISPFISPLYILGVLIPILVLLSLNSRGLPRKRPSAIDLTFNLFAALFFSQALILLIFNGTLDAIGNTIQYVTPIFLFFYLRRVLSDPSHLNGILQTFFISASISIVLIPVTIIFGSNSFQQISQGRGGGFRFHGGYADMMNYAIYITGAFLILGFFFLQSVEDTQRQRLARRRLLLFLPIGVGSLYAIKHTASWAVFIMLFGLFLVFAITSRKAQPLVLVLLLTGALAGQMLIEKQLTSLVRKEVRVIEGEAEVERSFNGRMRRWKRYFASWQDMGFFAKIFGTPLSYLERSSLQALAGGAPDPAEKVPIMVSGGMHSDYVRLIFLTGGSGLILYFLFIVGILKRGVKFRRDQRFLIFGAVLVVVFYSISTNPLLYQPMMNYILTIFAFACVPPRWAKRVTVLRTRMKDIPLPNKLDPVPES